MEKSKGCRSKDSSNTTSSHNGRTRLSGLSSVLQRLSIYLYEREKMGASHGRKTHNEGHNFVQLNLLYGVFKLDMKQSQINTDASIRPTSANKTYSENTGYFC